MRHLRLHEETRERSTMGRRLKGKEEWGRDREDWVEPNQGEVPCSPAAIAITTPRPGVETKPVYNDILVLIEMLGYRHSCQIDTSKEMLQVN